MIHCHGHVEYKIMISFFRELMLNPLISSQLFIFRLRISMTNKNSNADTGHHYLIPRFIEDFFRKISVSIGWVQKYIQLSQKLCENQRKARCLLFHNKIVNFFFDVTFQKEFCKIFFKTIVFLSQHSFFF